MVVTACRQETFQSTKNKKPYRSNITENDCHIDKWDKTAAHVVNVVGFYLQFPIQPPVSFTSETSEKTGRKWGV